MKKLEEKLREIRKHMDGVVVFEVGMKSGRKIDILSVKNLGKKKGPKEELPLEDGTEYIG